MKRYTLTGTVSLMAATILTGQPVSATKNGECAELAGFARAVMAAIQRSATYPEVTKIKERFNQHASSTSVRRSTEWVMEIAGQQERRTTVSAREAAAKDFSDYVYAKCEAFQQCGNTAGAC